MNKDNVLFGIIGLLAGLIIGFLATNYVNRNSQPLVAAVAPATAVPNAPVGAPGQAAPQINNQVVRDQTQTGGRAAGAAQPQVQEKLDLAQKEPNNFEAQMAAGEMYYRIQRFDEAAEFYQKASRLKPDNYEVLVKTGNAFFDAKKFETAETWYTQALAKNPNDINVRTDLGVTFVERANPDLNRAIKEFRQSLEINPNHEQTLHNLVIALGRTGDTAGLQETLARLEKVDPTNPLINRFRQQN